MPFDQLIIDSALHLSHCVFVCRTHFEHKFW